MSSFQSTKRVIDAALEIPIVPGWTNLGYRIRRNLWAWGDPAPGSMSGSWALVTGGTSGIGRAGAEGLARAGAGVVITGRDPERAQAVAGEIARATGSEVIGLGADLSHLDQAAGLAKELMGRLDHVDVVVHNAGAMFAGYEEHDGIERTQVLHVLSPFLLTRRLSPLIPNSTRSRVVFMSSGGMYSHGLDVAKLQAGPAGYRGATAYSRAKRAQVALAHRFAERLPGRAVHAMHPGWVDTPALHESLPRFEKTLRPLLRRPEEGADTLIWLATAAAAGTTSGLFWLDRRPRREAMVIGAGSRAEEEALWDWCERITSAY
ncbi:MAG: SDR family NAD(P)-dependent oxidoreductase [Acidimicrobiales bacterium]